MNYPIFEIFFNKLIHVLFLYINRMVLIEFTIYNKKFTDEKNNNFGTTTTSFETSFERREVVE